MVFCAVALKMADWPWLNLLFNGLGILDNRCSWNWLRTTDKNSNIKTSLVYHSLAIIVTLTNACANYTS